MKAFQLDTMTQARTGGFTHKWEVDFADLSAAGTAKTLVLLIGKAYQYVERVAFKLDVPFDGGATSALALNIGYDNATLADDAGGFIRNQEIHKDATEILAGAGASIPTVAAVAADVVDGTYGAEEAAVIASLRTQLTALAADVATLRPKVFLEAWALELVATATGANLDALTVGKVIVYAKLCDLSEV